MLSTILGIALVIAAVLIAKSAVVLVRQGYKYTVEYLGKYQRTLEPGLHFLIPGLQRVKHRVNIMEQVLDVPSQEIITKDNAMVRVDGVAFFKVREPQKAVYMVNNLKHAVMNLVQTNLRTVMGSMDLDELLSRREEINARLLAVVDDATDAWGIKVMRIEIKDISPPHDLVESMARQMKAEREKRAVILEAEGVRQAEILRAEGDKQSQILEAEAEKESMFRRAEGREREAEAEAKATQMVSSAISDGNVQAVNYFVAQKYIEAFEKLASAPNQKVIMMPMESTGMIGSLAGIGELAKDVFNKTEAK